ncbi:MAG: thiamine-phosphate kinase [Armatimonadetes bacterium]|nr:thiamine-phosphate kinase [Armatimonadota bacterium]MCX7967629.1 thiamine-phosphate kinase [Armatimonadota bacterium]MDW8142870.1 thiamine-phosphate kinase [Armatimonadota bacterium]
MKVKELGEYPLVARLCERLQQVFGVDKRVLVGLGDDAAVLEINGVRLILTIDTQLENAHFRSKWMPAFDLGWKAVAISVSDVVAMGGKPIAALLGLGLTGEEPVAFVDEFYEGAISLCQSTGALLLGGDTVRSPIGLMVSSVVIGVVEGEPIQRKGAEVGDAIIMTGFAGEAAAGFWILEQGVNDLVSSPLLQRCVERFRRPKPRTNALQALRSFPVHAAIDISDGLVIDLQRMATASKVQITLDLTQIPISQSLKEAAKIVGRDASSLALTGGEDYELLISVSPSVAGEFRQALEEVGIPAHQIGFVSATHPNGEVVGKSPNGTVSALHGGFQHF